jgi:hypothetical protein
VTQGVAPEFKPQYCKKKKNLIQNRDCGIISSEIICFNGWVQRDREEKGERIDFQNQLPDNTLCFRAS